MKYKPFTKVLLNQGLGLIGVAAVYEPHPFRGFPELQKTEKEKLDYCWVFYDWCGNAVGMSDEKPSGKIVKEFTPDMFNGSPSLAEYLNREY